MNLIPFIGRQLKDPKVVEFLEHYDVPIIYDFDRLFENEPDEYWAHLYSQGLLFRFDEMQRLDTIFVYVTSTGKFAAHSCELTDFPMLENLGQAIRFVESNKLAHTVSSGKEGLPDWLRVEYSDHFVHYQFGSDGVSIITIMSRETAPGVA